MTLSTRIHAIVAAELGCSAADVLPTALLVADLGADSLALVEIMCAPEDEYEIEIPDEDMASITTVQGLVAYVARRVGDVP